MSQEKYIKIKKDSLWKIGFFVMVAAFIVVLILLINPNSGTAIVENTGGTGQAGVVSNVKVTIDDDDPVLGEKNADVSIVEFSDFQCPYCQRAHTDALAQFKTSDYYKNGDVNLVYKHLPLTSIHPYAQKAAEASVCAFDQNKFWEYHDMLFANQGSLDVTSLKNYAKTLSLNSVEFNKCLDNGDGKAKVSSDLSEATTAGARGTPYFVVINNKDKTTSVVSGAVPWTNFEAAINAVK